MKKIITLLLVVSMVTCMFAGCGSTGAVDAKGTAAAGTAAPETSEATASTAANDGLKIGIAMQAISTNPIFISAIKKIQEEADKNGDTLLFSYLFLFFLK